MKFFDENTGKVIKLIPEIDNVLNYYHLGLKEGDRLPEGYVYIGRKNNNPGLKELGESKYHNPFYVKKSKDKNENIKSRINAVQQYKKYLWGKLMEGEITKDEMKKLSGVKKVCFCGEYLCHGHVIELFIDYINRHEKEFDQKKEEYQKRKLESRSLSSCTISKNMFAKKPKP